MKLKNIEKTLEIVIGIILSPMFLVLLILEGISGSSNGGSSIDPDIDLQ